MGAVVTAFVVVEVVIGVVVDEEDEFVSLTKKKELSWVRGVTKDSTILASERCPHMSTRFILRIKTALSVSEEIMTTILHSLPLALLRFLLPPPMVPKCWFARCKEMR